MQLSTASFYDRSTAAMTALSARSDALTTQISTGRKLQAPSDDTVAYQRLQSIARDNADGTAYQTNITAAKTLLQQSDTTLTSIGTQLQRASELVLGARNGSMSDSDKSVIASELDSIVQSLVSLGNSKDARGQALFGGASTGDAITTNDDGTHGFADTQPSTIPIGEGQDVQPTENAARVFALDGGRNIIDVLSALSTTLKAGGDTGDSLDSAITDLKTAADQATTVQASLGARAARVDLQSTQLTNAATDREATRSSLEDTDITTAITELQKTMTVLSATQASFTKLSSLSLFDYLK